MRTLVWFRGKDLRAADHPPLIEGAKGELVCAFVLDPYFFSPARAREMPHRIQFLLSAIGSLRADLHARGGRLFVVQGKSVDVLPRLAKRWHVDRVVAQGWTEPFGRLRDDGIARALDVPLQLFEGETLAPHGTVRNAEGRPFSVYTSFARCVRANVRIDAPLPAPRDLPAPPRDVHAAEVGLPTLQDLGIAPNPRLPEGGERAARARLARFLRRSARYDAERDRLDLDATSRLSVDIKFGILSPRSIWHEAHRVLAKKHPRAWGCFSDQLLWREFAYALLWDDPSLLERPHRERGVPSSHGYSETSWRAWCEGKTGYPVVDAAARQLLGEGFVHNRARMIASSFLTKDLGIDYRHGEAHYMKYLVDGDWAQNNFNWQWTAGCGFDAAPYFRVFNPTAQGKKFDPTGAYVRRWLPELARLPDAWIHEPWRAPEDVLRAAGVTLGRTYPAPIVDHAEARMRFLGSVEEARRAVRTAAPGERPARRASSR